MLSGSYNTFLLDKTLKTILKVKAQFFSIVGYFFQVFLFQLFQVQIQYHFSNYSIFIAQWFLALLFLRLFKYILFVIVIIPNLQESFL